MSYRPISLTVPQYSKDGDELAAAYYLKGYEAGTSTALSMGTDYTGATTLAKCKLNTAGYPLSNAVDDTSVFIPHFDENYKLALYPTEADADANTNAVWTVDNLRPLSETSVESFGAVGDGVTDDTTAIQNALNSLSTDGGELFFPAGRYYITSALSVPSNVYLRGAGVGATTMYHPSSQCFRNSNWGTGSNSYITVENFTFDAGATFDGGVSMDGCSDLRCNNLTFINVKPTGVTVGIGVASTAVDINDIFISNCRFDVPDYGIVLDSIPSGGNSIRSAVITNCTFDIVWGSAVSLADDVKDVAITNNVFNLNASNVDQEGIGVKIWNATVLGAGGEEIAVTGNVFRGQNTRLDLTGVSIANYSRNITVTGNVFGDLTAALENQFSGVASGNGNLIFSDNTVRDCDEGFSAYTSSDGSPVITNNRFRNVNYAIRANLVGSTVTGNAFFDIGNIAIYCPALCEATSIVGNTFWTIGESCWDCSEGVVTSNQANIFASNNIVDSSTTTNGGANTIELNDQSHVITGNMIVNGSVSANKPAYIIGSAAGADYRVIGNNFMNGATTGYREVTGANDVYGDNLERGL